MVEAGRKISYTLDPNRTYPIPGRQENPLETLTYRLVHSAIVTDRLKVNQRGTITLPPDSLRLNTQYNYAFVDRYTAMMSFKYGFTEQSFGATRDEDTALRHMFTGYLEQGQVLAAPTQGKDPRQRIGSIHLFGHSPTQGPTACGLHLQTDNRGSLSGLIISRPGQMMEIPLPTVAFADDTTIIVGSTLSNGIPTAQPVAIETNAHITLGGQDKKLTFVAISGLEPGALALKRMPDGSLAIEQLAQYMGPGRSTLIATVKDAEQIATNVGINYPLRDKRGFRTPSGGMV